MLIVIMIVTIVASSDSPAEALEDVSAAVASGDEAEICLLA